MKILKRTALLIMFAATASFAYGLVNPVSVDAFQSAKVLYGQKCASCHGVDGSGQTPMGKKLGLKDLRSAEVQKLSDDKLYQLIANGSKDKKMPGYEKSLGKDQVKSLVGYVRELAKK